MTTFTWLRMHYRKAQNLCDILKNYKLNAGNATWEIDAYKFVETNCIAYNLGIFIRYHEFENWVFSHAICCHL